MTCGRWEAVKEGSRCRRLPNVRNHNGPFLNFEGKSLSINSLRNGVYLTTEPVISMYTMINNLKSRENVLVMVPLEHTKAWPL